ncbi:SMP-30/gluconolactonase/LRE family protein [Martelella soudanensis]|uniref:SMP-30/gluconolactonase/LRE family protein n=1 Tax=unclassified Martelella TaxID=2629616 RepID=UPI0015DE00BB|nr:MULTISPECIES: SMP-30/gluconolactonase/LRE family protein [unclassified Martelella]
MDIKKLVACDTVLGEGPLWDIPEQRLYWIDSLGNKIFRATEDGNEVKVWDVPQNIGAMALRDKGGALLSLADGFYTFDFETGEATVLEKVQHKSATVRLNDGKVDKHGRYVCGSLETTETKPDALLYSVGTDLSVRQIDDNITVSNGPCWSPDGSIFYFADSRAKMIYAYDYDLETGAVSNKRDFHAFGPEDGLPDGATVDAEGCVWSAGVYKGKIHRIAPDGARLLTIDMPTLCVASVMFGGANLDRLYVPTMRTPPVPDVDETHPDAGSLFVIDGLGIRGVPENRFGG